MTKVSVGRGSIVTGRRPSNIRVSEDGTFKGTQPEVNFQGATVSNNTSSNRVDVNVDSIKSGAYSTELQFNVDEEIFQDVTTVTFTLASSGNVNGVGKIIRLNTPTAVNFPANFEALENSAVLDPTKLNMYTLLYHSNWDGAGTERVIYTNTLFTAV